MGNHRAMVVSDTPPCHGRVRHAAVTAALARLSGCATDAVRRTGLHRELDRRADLLVDRMYVAEVLRTVRHRSVVVVGEVVDLALQQ